MEAFDHLRFPLKIILHATKNFGAENFIAEGGFGKVYRGEFSNTMGAVKLFNRLIDKADVSFRTEIMFLTSCSHENLISLIGFCDEGENRILVYEYAGNKSLDFHLTSPSLKWTQRLKICIGAACGLKYLHDPRGTQQRVLHRDIKSANILLDQNWNAKIADFGLSRHGPANQDRTFVFSEAKGTLGYCDPMYVEDMLLTKESDVYSFGVVLFEALCSRPCVEWKYTDERRSLPILVKKYQREEKSLRMIIDGTLSEQIDQDCFDTFVTIALQCLEKERTCRPKMESVVSKLKTALEFQEIFELKEEERRDSFSPNQVLLDNKSQETESSSSLDFSSVVGRNSVTLYTTTIQAIKKTFNFYKFAPKHTKLSSKIKRKIKTQEIFELKEEERRDSFSPNQVLLDNKSQETESSSSLDFSSVVGRNSVILYTTTIQAIRKTFNDCSSIRSIIKSYNVVYEERDLSMHSGFREELQKMLGRNVVPPKLFIKGRHIGGAKEVSSLHVQNKLLQLLAGIPENSSKRPCKECDGHGFVTCGYCEGSWRIRRGNSYGKCTICNKKGLVFCTSCKYATAIV